MAGPGREGARDARDEALAGLYVHVPFCSRRCTYCDFSSGSISSAALDRFLAGIEREAERRAAAASGLIFSSVFFGGGTPSALPARHFRRLWNTLSSRFRIAPGAEITLEANPESVKPPVLEAWGEAGVNRLSMGAQSFDADELRRLGRIHPPGRPAEAFALARASGFSRLSLDLMFGYPGSSLGSFSASLESALALEPGHLSAYCYIPEPGTPLGDAVLGGSLPLPPPDEQADSYAMLTGRLARAGYRCYETSNFCRPGEEARHNLVYWLRRPYVGLGPSAHGLFAGVRHGNHYALRRWAASLEALESPESEIESESPDSVAREIMMLGLRLADGIGERDYPARAWRQVMRRYSRAFERALATGRLEIARGHLRIPEKLRFVADDCIAWLDAEADASVFDSPAHRFLPSIPCPNPHSPAI